VPGVSPGTALRISVSQFKVWRCACGASPRSIRLHASCARLAVFFQKPLRERAGIWFFWIVLARGAREGLASHCSLKVHGWLCHPTVASAGKLVRFEHGCATVTGYNLPEPLVPPCGAGKAGVRSETRKSGHQPGSTLVGSRPRGAASPSKRRMRPACWNCLSSGSRMPSFPVLAESEGFLFSGSVTGLQTVPPRQELC
jgi:hypothetical protein